VGSPVSVGGTLYAVSDNGHVYAYRDQRPAENPLLGLTIESGSPLRAGTRTSLLFVIRGLNRGAAEHLALRIVLPPGLQMAGESSEEARAERVLDYTLAFLPHGGQSTDLYEVTPLDGYSTFVVRATLTYTDLAGRIYLPVDKSVTLPSTNAFSAAPWIAAGFLVAASVASLTVFALLRRKRRHE
jgi:hypothetical protein